ncbi:class I SAM-dependent methyltransferase [Meridianimarinicoccus zhengii]|uniref:class I SAM-dependent methyltransferase n=1 Tax=Meridianimarinicoccus zhengii TaxID=2056810 RepID=UPI000DAE1DC7|nr:TylF/MycF/NovP-related O-methyltransferase [Phycocomes zhengii]
MQDDFDFSMHPAFSDIWERVQPFTMISPERGFAVHQAVHAILDNGIGGSFVECGVWRGGAAMIMALTLLDRGAHREIILFDTFEGMTEPGENDLDMHGADAAALMAGINGETVATLVRAAASLEDVRVALASTGYDMGLVRFVKGDVRQTLAKTSTGRIALLRLDTDFYDSTLSEFTHLWPRLAEKGVFIVDDYGHWQGARKAYEDYFADPTHGHMPPLLWRTDYTGYAGVKMQAREAHGIARYDYTPPGFDTPDLSVHFPHAIAQNPQEVNWPYLRAQVPHLWRSDLRDDKPWRTGNASMEEAACLYTLARQFEGKRGLEIGTHFGWTAAHLARAGLKVDCIDPELNHALRIEQVRSVLDAVSDPGSYRLWGGFSPDMVPEARASGDAPWSFAFIDGNHDSDGPRQDALAVIPHLDQSALVVFHDLTSPFVERGLYAFRQAGFSTRLFNTMQVLGVAWRGKVAVPRHIPDPNVPPYLPMHLDKYDRSV